MPASSAAGFLAQLDERDNKIKAKALSKLDMVVDQFWAEISDAVAKIESLYEDEKFPERELAALVASKVFYHLGNFNDALTYALGAGRLFKVGTKNDYVETIVAKSIDQYIRLRREQADGSNVAIDPRLENIVARMFESSFKAKEYKQAVGIALEARRLDKVEEGIKRSSSQGAMLAYCFQVSQQLVLNRDFRLAVFRVLVQLYMSGSNPDFIEVCRIMIFLDDAQGVAGILTKLIEADEKKKDKHLTAYQIAFNLVDSATQQFLSNVLQRVPTPKGSPDTDAGSARVAQLRAILSGEVTIRLHLEFLFRNMHTDLQIIKNVKSAVDARNSICHNATVIAHGLMYAGTTVDAFLRSNLDWLGRATNWAKFTATASLGVIHKGHLSEGRTILAPYLGSSGQAGSSAYSEGGALYALGIIHANHGADATQFLLQSLRSANGNAVIQHGACLGLGTAAMATGHAEVYDELKNVLYTDNAVAGEAAGLAMGLVMLGTGAKAALDEMIQYAHETQHEKILRGLAIGMALVMYGREEGADPLIEQLCMDKDALLRYGGMYAVGMAYAGTSNNRAIRRLLHVAVSDVSDDVRRAAVSNLGFVLSNQPEECPRIVSLLAESYNPHVRYGATLAVGSCCAGTGRKEAIALLEPMLKDSVDFVRQGALVAMAMVLVQRSEALDSKVTWFREHMSKVINDKHEDIMAKFGAILATGILDAGGRNVTLALHGTSGHKNTGAFVGLAVFSQYWYWYPLIHFLSLALTPTALIALNGNLRMPKFAFTSNARPSLYAYPAPIKAEVKEAPKKVSKAVLSVSTRRHGSLSGRASAVSSPAGGDAKPSRSSGSGKDDATSPVQAISPPRKKHSSGEKRSGGKRSSGSRGSSSSSSKKGSSSSDAVAKAPEPASETLQNPARVTPLQAAHVSYDADKRYTPIKSSITSGIVLLQDGKPKEAEELIEVAQPGAAGAGAGADDGPEPQPPEPFEYP